MQCNWKVQFHQIGSFSRHLSSGLRFLLTLVLILALAFATCAAFIVFCRKCDEEVRVFSTASGALVVGGVIPVTRVSNG